MKFLEKRLDASDLPVPEVVIDGSVAYYDTSERKILMPELSENDPENVFLLCTYVAMFVHQEVNPRLFSTFEAEKKSGEEDQDLRDPRIRSIRFKEQLVQHIVPTYAALECLAHILNEKISRQAETYLLLTNALELRNVPAGIQKYRCEAGVLEGVRLRNLARVTGRNFLPVLSRIQTQENYIGFCGETAPSLLTKDGPLVHLVLSSEMPATTTGYNS